MNPFHLFAEAAPGAPKLAPPISLDAYTTGIRPEFRPWINVAAVVVLIILVPLFTRAARAVWLMGLRKIPLDRDRAVQRIETLLAFFRSVAYFMLGTMGIFFVVNALSPDFDPLAATGALSIIALVLTGMFRDVVVDVVKGLDILLGRHYDVGDFIEVGTHAGHVIDFQLKYTRLRTAAGQEIVVNNSSCIPSRRYRQGWVTCHARIPLKDPGDQPRAWAALERAGAELCQQVEAVQNMPSYQETISAPVMGGAVLCYVLRVLPDQQAHVERTYLRLVRQTLEAADVPLAADPTCYFMNDVETFRKLFRRRLSAAEIEQWAQRNDETPVPNS